MTTGIPGQRAHSLFLKSPELGKQVRSPVGLQMEYLRLELCRLYSTFMAGTNVLEYPGRGITKDCNRDHTVITGPLLGHLAKFRALFSSPFPPGRC